MTTAPCFDVTCDAGVAHLRMIREERMNAMTREFWLELPAHLRALDAAGGVRAAVISSSGKHFSAGMDLSVFQGSDALGTDSVAAQKNRTAPVFEDLPPLRPAIDPRLGRA